MGEKTRAKTGSPPAVFRKGKLAAGRGPAGMATRSLGGERLPPESNHPARGWATGWRGLRGASGVRLQEPEFLNLLENLGAPPEVARRRELGVTAVVLLEQWCHKCGNWRRGLAVPSQTLRTDGSRTGGRGRETRASVTLAGGPRRVGGRNRARCVRDRVHYEGLVPGFDDLGLDDAYPMNSAPNRACDWKPQLLSQLRACQGAGKGVNSAHEERRPRVSVPPA